MKKEIGEGRPADEIHALLEAADPLRVEPDLVASDADRMRQAVLNAVPTASTVVWWPRAFAAAALIIVMVIAGTMSSRRKVGNVQPGDATKVAAPGEPAERRQLQFETPGGTRIIWTLDPAFKLEGVAP
jgi:hypothetical protein